VKLAEQFKMEK